VINNSAIPNFFTLTLVTTSFPPGDKYPASKGRNLQLPKSTEQQLLMQKEREMDPLEEKHVYSMEKTMERKL
jgi:hypothetical protein